MCHLALHTNPCFHEHQIHQVFKEEQQMFDDVGSLDLIFTLRHMDTIPLKKK